MQIDVMGTLPKYMTEGAAGADLEAKQAYTILPREKALVGTGTYLQLPPYTFGMMVPRSSLCNKGGLQLVNSVGVLDEDYTGELIFCYKNNGFQTVKIEKGERIGQVVVIPYLKADFRKVEELGETVRGSGGFGSTNVGENT